MPLRMRPLLLSAAMLSLVAGCRRSDAGTSRSPGSAVPAPPDSTLVLGPGDVLIRTTDGAVELALVRDTVWMKLSDSVLANVRTTLDTTGDAHDSAFGARIARFVKGTVGPALQQRLQLPLSDIDAVHYHDGTIEFDYHGNKRPAVSILGRTKAMPFEYVRDNDQQALASFSQADAERFVAAVRAAKGRG